MEQHWSVGGQGQAGGLQQVGSSLREIFSFSAGGPQISDCHSVTDP